MTQYIIVGLIMLACVFFLCENSCSNRKNATAAAAAENAAVAVK